MRTLAVLLVVVGFMAFRRPAHADSVIDCSVSMNTLGSFLSYYVPPGDPPAVFSCTAPSGMSTMYSYVSPGGGGIAPNGDVQCEIPGASDYDMDVDANSDPVTECGTRMATPSFSVYIRSKAKLGRVASWTYFENASYPAGDGNTQWSYSASHSHTTKFTVAHSRVYRLYGSRTPTNHNPGDGRKAEVTVKLERWSGTDCTTPTYDFLTNPAPTPSGIALNGGGSLPVGDYCLTVFGKIEGFTTSSNVQGEHPAGPELDWDYWVQP